MPLTSGRLLLLLVAALAVLLGCVARARSLSPRHPVMVRVGTSLLLLVVAVATAGDVVNRHFGLYRSWRDLLGVHSRDLVNASTAPALARAVAAVPRTAAPPTRGTLLQLRIPGRASGVSARNAFVYLPPQYRDPRFARRRFPVMEAFQGSPGRPSDWVLGLHVDALMDAGIRRGAVAPTVVVIPDTNGGLSRSLECADTADGIADETFLTRDVRSWAMGHLRVDPRGWVAAGYSTGGYCALDLAFRHPDLFGRAVSLDGYAHALSDRYARHLWRSAADRLAHSPDWWVVHHVPAAVRVYLLAGSSDREATHDTLAFWRVLRAAHWWRPQDALVVQRHGRHTFPSWQSALGPALVWASPGRSTLSGRR